MKKALFALVTMVASVSVAMASAASGGHDDGHGGDHKEAAEQTSEHSSPAHSSPKPKHKSDKHEADGHSSAGGGMVHWAYTGKEGPLHWGSLSDEFALCGTGRQQSPINIKAEEQMHLLPLEFHYRGSSLSQVINNGHTIQVNYAQGSYVSIGSKKYALLQFHFHAPSEHKIHGKHADMVAHLVHKSEEGELLVVAVLFDRGAENKFLSPVWRAMPKHKGEAIVSGTLNMTRLLPSSKRYYNYLGSLTTPPCTQGVNWNILTTRVSVSASQVKAFKAIFPKSVRPVQKVNARIIGVN